MVISATTATIPPIVKILFLLHFFFLITLSTFLNDLGNFKSVSYISTTDISSYCYRIVSQYDAYNIQISKNLVRKVIRLYPFRMTFTHIKTNSLFYGTTICQKPGPLIYISLERFCSTKVFVSNTPLVRF